MNKLIVLPLQIAIAAVLSVTPVAASNINDYLEDINKVSVSDLAHYLPESNIPDSVKKPEVEPKAYDVDRSIAVSNIIKKVPLESFVVPPSRSAYDVINLDRAISVNTPDAVDELYLRNIPEGSIVKFEQELTLLPNEKTAYFQNGKRIYSMPTVSVKGNNTFCMASLTQTGKARVIKKLRAFVVTTVKEHVSVFRAEDPSKDAQIRISKVILNNVNLKEFVCISAGSERPLTVGDLREATGGMLSVQPQGYVEI